MNKSIVYSKQIFGFIVLTIAAVDALGWFLEIPILVNWLPGGATMKMNTAILFCLAVIPFYTSIQNKFKWLHNTGIIAGLMMSVITLDSYVFDLPFSIDNLIVEDRWSSKYPGRPSPGTSLCFLFIFIGHSIKTFIPKYDVKHRVFFLLNLFVILISLLAIVSYLVGVDLVKRTIALESMALSTGLLFFFSANFNLVSHPIPIVDEVINQSYSGSYLFIRFYFLSVLSFIGSVLLYPLLISNFDLSTDFAFAFVVILVISIMLSFLFISAIKLNRTDIQRDKSLKSLQESEQKNLKLIDSMDQVSIVVTTDNKGIIKYVNEAFITISGYSEKELIGTNINLLKSGYHPKEFYLELWNMIKTGQIWRGEIKNKRKDGSFYWVDTSIVPIMQEGNIVEFLSIRNDITAKKEEQTLIESSYLERLQDKNAQLEEFSHIASHDIKQPLNSILGLAMLMQDTITDEEQYSTETTDFSTHIQHIRTVAERGIDLVQSILDDTKLDVPRSKTHEDVTEIVKQVLNDLSGIINKKRAAITVEPLPTLMVYPNLMRRLFQNLITNAILYADPNRPIEIRIDCQNLPSHQVCLFIKDNGKGIHPEEIDQIFEVHKRGSSSSDEDGHGIGLPQCKKIAELHGATLTVESTIGVGSQFNFII